jgi:hypothetical protein
MTHTKLSSASMLLLKPLSNSTLPITFLGNYSGVALWLRRTPAFVVGSVCGICSSWKMVWLKWGTLKGGLKVEELFMKFFKGDGGISCLYSTN